MNTPKMYNFNKGISNDSSFFQKNKYYIAIGFALTLIIITLVICYNTGLLSQSKSKFVTNNEITSSKENNTAELLLFHTDWCPHCRVAMPIWEDLKKTYENKTINGYRLVFTGVDCSNDNAECERMMNKYNVEGFPTIKLLKDGQVIEYDAKPSKETIIEFLNTVL